MDDDVDAIAVADVAEVLDGDFSSDFVSSKRRKMERMEDEEDVDGDVLSGRKPGRRKMAAKLLDRGVEPLPDFETCKNMGE